MNVEVPSISLRGNSSDMEKSRSGDRLLRLRDRDQYHVLLCSFVIYLKNAAASESLSILSGSSFFELLSLSESRPLSMAQFIAFFS